MTKAREGRSPEDLTGSEIALHIGEFVASVIPVLGGPLEKTLAFVRESRDRRVPDLIDDLDHRFKQLGDRLDEDFVATADYAGRWEATMEEAVRARQIDKREYYLRALTAIAAKDRPRLDEWDFNMDTLNRIDRPALRVLAAATVEPINVIETTAQWAYLRSHVDEMDDVTLARCWDDLATLGLFSMRTVLVADVHAGPADTEGLLTAYGQRFVRFLGLGGGEAQQPASRDIDQR
jgi:hypothetical protein